MTPPSYKGQPRDSKGRFAPKPKNDVSGVGSGKRTAAVQRQISQPRDSKGRFAPYPKNARKPRAVEKEGAKAKRARPVLNREHPKGWEQPRDSSGRFSSFTEGRGYSSNPAIAKDRGGRYALVCKVNYVSNGKRETSYHTVIQHTKYFDDSTQRALLDRVMQMYNGKGVSITPVQTIDRLAPEDKRLSYYAIYR